MLFQHGKGPIFHDFVWLSFMDGPLQSFYVQEQLEKAVIKTNFEQRISLYFVYYFTGLTLNIINKHKWK